MEYNCYSIKTLNFVWETLHSGEINNAMDFLIDKFGYPIISIVNMFENVEKKPSFEIKKYLRIGEPALKSDVCEYQRSYNFAAQRLERGVSVITEKWLNGCGIFWGAYHRAKSHGVWEIEGVEITTGGDDEPLIYPFGFAKKTRITTVDGIKKRLKVLEEENNKGE